MKAAVIAMFTVAALGALLLGLTAAQHMQDQRKLALADAQNRADRALISVLASQVQDARKALADRPVVEKLVTPPCPQVRDVGHQTPIFSRDSQLFAGR